MHLIAASAIKRDQARLGSTIEILVGVVMTSVVLPSDSAVGIFSAAAYGVGVTLAGAILIEARSGIRSLIRVDLLLFLVVTFLGYLHILLAVDFDIPEAIRQMLLPRFSQSWSRGQYGDAAALLYEVGVLISLIPPMAGLIFARARQYSPAQKAVVVI